MSPDNPQLGKSGLILPTAPHLLSGAMTLKPSQKSPSAIKAPETPKLNLTPNTLQRPNSFVASKLDYNSLFKEEVSIYLKEIDHALQQLSSQEQIEQPWIVLRSKFHTIKGTASTLDLTTITSLSDQGEALSSKAVDDPQFRTSALITTCFNLRNQLATQLELPLLPNLNSLIDFPISTNSEHKVIPLIKLALTILNDWQLKPELPSYQVEFRSSLQKITSALRAHQNLELARNFQLFSEFLETLPSGAFIPPFFIVARRCLHDATIFLNDLGRSPWLTWNRKWSFYFSSLRIALAADAKLLSIHSSLSSQPVGQLDLEMIEVFSQEATVQFEQIEKSLLAWESHQDIPQQIKTVRRCFHTLKGAANSVDLRGLGLGFHFLEDYIETLNSDSDSIPSSIFQFLLNCSDQAKVYISNLTTSTTAQPWPHDWKESLHQLKRSNQKNISSQLPIDLDMLESFIEESTVTFELVESAIIAWEKLDQPEDQKAQLSRAFHTLKGAANSIGLNALGLSFHTLEDFMETVKSEEPPVGLFEFLLKCSDQVRLYLEALAQRNDSPWLHDWNLSIDDLKAGKIQGLSLTPIQDPSFLHQDRKSTEERQVVRVEAEKLRQAMHLISEIMADHSSFEAHLDQLSPPILKWNKCSKMIAQLLQTISAEPTHAKSKSTNASAEKELRRIKSLLSHLTEEVDQQNRLSASLKPLLDSLKEDTQQFRRSSRRLQTDLAALNMAPVSGLFRRLQRVFRDALMEENKQAELILEGEQTFLDKTVVDALYGPLLHVVRNAVAHGIESPEKRSTLNKPSAGRVVLRAKPLSNQVIIEVSDDGSGIHESMVRRRAIERGMIPEDAPDLNSEQIVELLFRPGFSTKETVSSVAGRGVGLDVVKGEIESMNGSVNLDYVVGQGSLWTIKVPLTLSASEALIVTVGNLRLALPLSYVQRCLLINPAHLSTRQGVLTYQSDPSSNPLPCLHLAKLFNTASSTSSPLGVVVDSGLIRAVFLVDSLVTRREIVTKDLGSLVGSLPFLSGATLDADGSLICILQIPSILQRLAAEITRTTTTLSPPSPSSPISPSPSSQTLIQTETTKKEFILGRNPRILLCDDSPSVRKVQEKQLTQLGYEVTTACDGQEALNRMQLEDFDLILTDLEMPHVDGFELVRTSRTLERFKHIPIIVVTSRAMEKFAEDTIRLGATACLGKPFSLPQFERLITNEDKLSSLRRQSP